MKCKLLAAMCFVALTSHAAATPTLKVEVGYEGNVVTGNWVPIFVTTTSEPTDPAIRGKLLVNGSAIDQPNSFATDINLAPGATKRHCLFVPSRFLAAREVKLLDESLEVLASEKLPSVNTVSANKNSIVLVISESKTALSMLNPQSKKDKSTKFNVTWLKSADLPTVSWALDGLAMIVLHDIPKSLSPGQLKSLQRYVENGGLLLTIAASHPFYKEPGLRSLLPTQITTQRNPVSEEARTILGLPENTKATLPAFAPAPNLQFWPPGPATAIFSYREYGFGVSALMAIDPDQPEFRSSRYMKSMFKSIVELGNGGQGAGAPYYPSKLLLPQSKQLFEDFEVISPLTLFLALIFVGAYVFFLTQIAPILNRKFKIPSVILLPPLTIGVGLGIIFLASLGQSESKAMAISYEIVTEPTIIQEGIEQTSVTRVIDLGIIAGSDESFNIKFDSEYRPETVRKGLLSTFISPMDPCQFFYSSSQNSEIRPLKLFASNFTSIRLQTRRFRPIPIKFSCSKEATAPTAIMENLTTQNIGPIVVMVPKKRGKYHVRFVPALKPLETVTLRQFMDLKTVYEDYVEQTNYWQKSEIEQAPKLLVQTLNGLTTNRDIPFGSENRSKTAFLALYEPQDVPIVVDRVNEPENPITIQRGGQILVIGTGVEGHK